MIGSAIRGAKFATLGATRDHLALQEEPPSCEWRDVSGATCGCEAQGPTVQRAGERESGCLPCDINDLVREHVEGGSNDLGEIAAMMAESLDVVFMSQEDCANLMARVVSAFGQVVLEKRGAFESTSSAT